MKPIPLHGLWGNIFETIGERGMLIVGGKPGSYNMMTATWGGFGVVWNEPAAFLFVRPSRYTHEFLLAYPSLSVVFLPEGYEHILQICGSQSGRHIDKMRLEGLTPVDLGGVVGFEEASLVISCETMYRQPLEASALQREDIKRAFYQNGDYHDLFLAKILGVWRSQ